MDCTKCTTKGCRKDKPCSDRSGDYLETYLYEDNQNTIKAASALIDNGRAGTLSRLQEIVEYFRHRGYKKLGVAYCYGMEREATQLRKYLEKQSIQTVFISCTVDGLKENQLNPDKTSGSVSCNPLGQAAAINDEGVDLTLLMGLCLGHDILIQKNLKMDFTTFVVKDRVYGHHPLQALKDMSDTD